MTTGERLVRESVPEMDELLGHTFRVLDKGHIRVIDYMGSDAAIVQAARVSYGKGTKTMSEDRGLIRYLMRHRHTTPFEMCELKLHLRVPMDHWRQWIRHRTASVNEYSTRYSEAIEDKQVTLPGQWRFQSGANKQGSGDFIPPDVGANLTMQEARLHSMVNDVYQGRLNSGVAREQARKDLPLSTYTEAYWKVDVHNLLHFLSLRMDKHAQLEIRSYAEVIGQAIVAKWLPLTWEAFTDYRLYAMTFSRQEVEMLVALISGGVVPLLKGRELEEFKDKAYRLGVSFN
jgi:thymidylate synthase (FAD)